MGSKFRSVQLLHKTELCRMSGFGASLSGDISTWQWVRLDFFLEQYKGLEICKWDRNLVSVLKRHIGTTATLQLLIFTARKRSWGTEWVWRRLFIIFLTNYGKKVIKRETFKNRSLSQLISFRNLECPRKFGLDSSRLGGHWNFFFLSSHLPNQVPTTRFCWRLLKCQLQSWDGKGLFLRTWRLLSLNYWFTRACFCHRLILKYLALAGMFEKDVVLLT